MAVKAVTAAILIIGLAAVLIAMKKSGHFFQSLFTTAFQGVASLLAVNVIGLVSGVTLAINMYTIGFACFFGIPACISMTLLKLILK